MYSVLEFNESARRGVIELIGQIFALVPGTCEYQGKSKYQGCNKFSHISAAAIGDSWTHVPFMYRVFFTVTVLRHVKMELLRAENVVKASGLDYQLNRPLLLTNEPLSGKKTRIVAEAPFIDQISRADVADFMLDEVHEHSFTERVPMIMSGV
jgi:hypothetical protein